MHLLTVTGMYHQIVDGDNQGIYPLRSQGLFDDACTISVRQFKRKLGLLMRVCYTGTQDASLGYTAKACLKNGGAGAGNWYLIKAWDAIKS